MAPTETTVDGVGTQRRHALEERPERQGEGIGQRIGLERMAAPGHIADEGHIPRVRHDRESFGHCRAYAAGMIEVMMSVHRVAEGLVRPQLARLGDDGERPRIVLRSLDEHEVLIELDEHAMV